MKKTNYHTHTYRCGHANGTEEDMVKAALDIKLDTIGFSCHVPLPKLRLHLFKSIPSIRGIRSFASLIRSSILNGPNMRMPYKKMEEHLSSIDYCIDLYGNQIQIYKGFEAEGIKEYFDYYQSLLDENKVDYLILGHHFHKHCIHDDYYGREHLSKKAIYQYCNDVEKAMDTGLFSYFAHPDLFCMGYHDFDLDMQTVSRRICEKAKANNIPLEINAGGMRKGLKEFNGEELYLYPNKHFFEIASEIGNDVILGIDAHDPSDFNEGIYKQMIHFAMDLNLHIVTEFEFKKGHQK